jgi:hypothetical protein
MVGFLADGTPFTSSTFLTRRSEVPLYASFRKPAGLLAGKAILDPSQNDTDVTGPEIHWFLRANPARHYYPAGFEVSLDLLGARQSTSTPAALGLSPQPVAVFSSGPFPEPVSIGLIRTSATRYAPADRATNLTFSLGTDGQFGGIYTPSRSAGRHPFRGVIVAKGDFKQTFGSILTPLPFKSTGEGLGGAVRILPE